MGDARLAVFDHTLQQTDIWLKKLVAEHHFENRQQAYEALRAVLHVLRDLLAPVQALHLSAQLPMLIRGIYFEGWRLADKPNPDATIDEFTARVAAALPKSFSRDELGTTCAVLAVLAEQIDAGEVAKIVDLPPISLRSLWPIGLPRWT